MKTRIAVLFFAFMSVYITFNREAYENNMFTWDAGDYYLYVPAVFVYHDLGHFGFFAEVNKKYNQTDDLNEYGMYHMPTGRLINKYAIGSSLFELPFFLIAHLYCNITHGFEADGYSIPYQLAGHFCFIFWVAWGLWLLGVLLRRYFNDTVAAITVLCIAFGTNLYCYTVFIPGMSHPFLFFLFSAVLYHTDLYYATLKKKHLYWLGLTLGLIIISRPVDIVIALLPLLWHVYNKDSLLERARFLKQHVKELGVSLIIFFAVCFIQMAYWKYASGEWIHYSYQGETFNFRHPHIIDGLFSYQKGWFVYTPLAFLALAGFFFMKESRRKMMLPFILSMALLVYIVFSWRIWWYGGGFGSRPLIDPLAIVAMLLGFVMWQVFYKWKNVPVKIFYSLLLVFFISLNLFQTFQYSKGTIHYVKMNRAYYWRVFGKVLATDEDLKYMMTDQEYVKEVIESQK